MSVDAPPAREIARSEALALGTLGNWAAKGATLGLWFVVTPFLVRRLGARDFGIWALVQSIVALTSILDFAIAAALTREVAAERAGATGSKRIPATASTVLWLSVAYAALTLALVIASANVLASWISSAESHDTTVRIIILTGVHVAVSMPYAAIVAMLRGLRRFDLANLSTVLTGAGSAVAATAIVAAGGGILALLTVLPAVLLATLLVSLGLVRIAAPDLALGIRGVRLASVPEIVRFAAPIFAAAAAARLQTRAGEIVVGLTLPLASVTPFALARRIGEVPQHLVDQTTKALLPFASELDAQSDRRRLRELYLAANRLTLAILFPSAALVAVLGQSFLAVWIGPELDDQGILVALLAFAALFEAAQWISAAMLQAMGGHRPLALIGTVAAGVSLGLSLVLAPRWGTLGVALGVLAATSLATAGAVFPLALRRLDLPARDLLRRSVWPAAWPALPALVAAAALDHVLSPPSWASLALAASAFGLLYAAVFLGFAAEPQDRALVGDLRRRAFPGASGRAREGPASGRPIKVMNVVARLNVGGPAVHVALVTARMGPPGYESRLVSGAVSATEGDMSYYALRWGVVPTVIPELGRELHPVRDLVTLWKLFRRIREFAPDVVHTNTAKAGTIGRLAARLAGVPVVVHTFHGHVFHGYFSPLVTRFFIVLERIGARLSDRLITLSEELRTDLSERYRIAPADRIRVVRNGLDLEGLARQPRKTGTFRRRLGIPADAPLIGIVGRMVPVKNHALFLEAAALVRRARPEARFVLIGDGELRAEVEARIDELALRDHTTITGWIADPADAYADLDVNVLTSDNEGTPLTLIEALTAGAPVVATSVGGVPDLLEHGRLGLLVPPADAGALAQAILRTLAAPPDADAVREHVRREYGIDRLVGDLDRLYRELLEEKRLGGSTPPAP